jgi:hypothetical protein
VEVGANVITASDNYGSSASATVNVLPDGYIWSYAFGQEFSCGYYMNIAVGCFDTDNSYLYAAYETIEQFYGKEADPGEAQYPGHPAIPIQHIVTIPDELTAGCPDPHYATNPPAAYVFKTWHVQYRDHAFLDDITKCKDVVAILYNRPSQDQAIIADNQCSPAKVYP